MRVVLLAKTINGGIKLYMRSEKSNSVCILKYPSIENYYNVFKNKYLNSFMDDVFYATEKIHGSNMQILVTPNSVEYYSRNQLVGKNDSLGSRLDACENTHRMISLAQDYIRENPDVIEVYVFGELYGSGIQHFEIFVKTNEVFRSFSLEELQNFVPEDILVPFVRIDTLKNLMDTPLSPESALGGEKEGLVYKPINSQIFELDKDTGAIQNYVAVKHKTEKFTEIKNNAKEKKQIELSTEQAKFNYEVDRYFTMTRLESVMSKETFDIDLKNLGKIIPLYLADVREDYLKTGEPFFEKIFGKKASLVVQLVKEYLTREEV